MVKQITKNQHYIPESLLWNFVNKDQKLFEVLLENKKIYPTNPSDSMCEKYTYEDQNLPINTVEDYFAKIDGEVAPLVSQVIVSIDKLKNGEHGIDNTKKLVENLLTRFLVFYYRSGALLNEFSSINEKEKIPLLSEKILNFDYINDLSESIKKHYKFAIIESEDDFLLSDQFISTSALKIKTQFSDLSNRHIGLNETLILIPISSKYYVVYWNTKDEFICKEEVVNILSDKDLLLINNTIINNSYKKSIGQKKERIEESLKFYRFSSPTQIYAGGGPSGHFMGSIKKKEIFFYEEESEVYRMLEHASFTIYRDLERNDRCACKSGKKFKKCHLDAYNRVEKINQTFGRSDLENMMDFLIYGITTIEQPIDKWSGYAKE